MKPDQPPVVLVDSELGGVEGAETVLLVGILVGDLSHPHPTRNYTPRYFMCGCHGAGSSRKTASRQDGDATSWWRHKDVPALHSWRHGSALRMGNGDRWPRDLAIGEEGEFLAAGIGEE